MFTDRLKKHGMRVVRESNRSLPVLLLLVLSNPGG